jgi:hypothetical protein
MAPGLPRCARNDEAANTPIVPGFGTVPISVQHLAVTFEGDSDDMKPDSSIEDNKKKKNVTCMACSWLLARVEKRR